MIQILRCLKVNDIHKDEMHHTFNEDFDYKSFLINVFCKITRNT